LRQEVAQIPLTKAELHAAHEELARLQVQLRDARQETLDLRDHLDQVYAESDARYQAAEQWKREAEAERIKVEILRDRVAMAEKEALIAKDYSDGLQAQVQQLLASTSWRVTQPLRAVVRRLRRS
jgi:hypothetical protein